MKEEEKEQQKTLIVNRSTHKKLMLSKIEKNFKSIDEVILYLFELENKVNILNGS